MWVTKLTLDGELVDLGDTLAELVIRQGRGTVDDGATASSVQLTILEVDRAFARAFTVGVPLAIHAGELGQPDAPRFTGTVTDAVLDDDRLTVIAVGPLATLERYTVGAGDWPAERWSARVLRAFTEAGLAGLLELQADADFDPLLVARVGDPVNLYSYVGTLATDVGAAIVDTPAGHVLIQQLTARASSAGVLPWVAVPPSLRWADVDPDTSWAEATSLHALDPGSYPDFGAVLDVDPDTVLYVPIWRQALEVENVTTVGYGDDLETTVDEPASLALFGPYPGGVQTQISSLADANERAAQRVTRRAYPRWTIRGATLLAGVNAFVGELVRLSDFPDGSPAERWDGVLEGWVDTIAGDEWTMELALSDPQFSGLAITWAQTPADVAWADVDPATSWAEATSLDALNAT